MYFKSRSANRVALTIHLLDELCFAIILHLSGQSNNWYIVKMGLRYKGYFKIIFNI